MQIQILPSLLAADFGALRAEALRAENEGADSLHLDIMDAHFVPNLSVGPDVVKMCKEVLQIPLSVHLMMTRPDQYFINFIEAGADSLLIHIEADRDVPKPLHRIHEHGAKAGITLNPGTPARMIFPVVDIVEEVLCMTVHPGYGGQSFIREVLPKIREIRDFANGNGSADLDIMVDGGINAETAAECARAGTNLFVAGTSLFGEADMKRAIDRMRVAACEAFVS